MSMKNELTAEEWLVLNEYLMYGGKWIIGEKYLELTIPPMLKKSKRAYKGD